MWADVWPSANDLRLLLVQSEHRHRELPPTVEKIHKPIAGIDLLGRVVWLLVPDTVD